jgi:hypothetical protein
MAKRSPDLEGWGGRAPVVGSRKIVDYALRSRRDWGKFFVLNKGGVIIEGYSSVIFKGLDLWMHSISRILV